MRLYFLRHADALPGADDAARPLSPDGRKQCEQLGKFLKKAGIVFDAAYTSPLVRAMETAKLVLPITNKANPIKLELAGAMLNESRNFPVWVASLPELKHILLVGHEPSISARVSALLGVKDAEQFAFPKGGLACLKTDDAACYTLKFFISPKILGED